MSLRCSVRWRRPAKSLGARSDRRIRLSAWRVHVKGVRYAGGTRCSGVGQTLGIRGSLYRKAIERLAHPRPRVGEAGPRTVEWHSGKVLGKLGVSSRKDPRAALSDVGAALVSLYQPPGPGPQEPNQGGEMRGRSSGWPLLYLSASWMSCSPRCSASLTPTYRR